MKTRAGRLIDRLRAEISIYQRALTDPRTPKLAKWLLGVALFYLLSPIDIVPDFIPLVGQLDDLIIVPILVWIALRLIPKEVMADCRQYVAGQRTSA